MMKGSERCTSRTAGRNPLTAFRPSLQPPPPANPRPNLARRRSPLLLLAAALAVLAVVFVNHAPPASADHTSDEVIWSGTLTVRSLGAGDVGCDSALSQTVPKCSTSTTLSENDFTYNGTNYRIDGLRNDQSAANLKLFVGSGSQTVSPNVLRGLVLVVDGKRYSFFSATIDINNGATWSVSENWSVGDTVQLKLVPPYWTGVEFYSGVTRDADGYQHKEPQ